MRCLNYRTYYRAAQTNKSRERDLSTHLIELILLAGIAFLIINKFISILGTSDEDDPTRKSGSFFGEPSGLKDVTRSVPQEEAGAKANNIINIAKRIKKTSAKVPEHMEALYNAFPNFEPEKFLKGAKGALSMVITALNQKDLDIIEDLVDKRYIEQIKELSDTYGASAKKIEASIIDSYSLGNSIYAKVLFKGATSKIKSLKEEWVFTKNLQQSGPDWYLSNIER